jgi:hypothetical protein
MVTNMRTVLFVVTVILASLLSFGAALLAVVSFHGLPDGLRVAVTVAGSFAVTGPLLLGSLAGYWDLRRARESRRPIRRWVVGVVAVQVISAVLVVIAAVVTGSPLWVPIVLVGGSAVLLALAVPIGSAFRRNERPAPPGATWVAVPPEEVSRAVRAVVITFVATAVGSVTLVVVLGLSDPRDGDGIVELLVIALQLTFTGTGLAAAIASRKFSMALRDLAGRDLDRVRRLSRVVLRGKDEILDQSDGRAAARYAATAPLALGFQVLYIVMLYIGIGTSLSRQLFERGSFGPGLPGAFLVLMVGVLVVVVPMTVRRIGRARAYAAAHADLLGPASATTSGSADDSGGQHIVGAGG